MQAGTLNPISVTGWNQDVVIGVGETYNTGSTAQLDNASGTTGGAMVWYGVGLNTSYPTTGLPTGLIQSATSSDVYFQLQSFGSAAGTNNNAVYGGGTLTLVTVAAYDHIALIGATGQGTANLTITFNYTTGDPDVYSSLGTDSINHDWFGGGSIAYTANGRISTVSGDFEYVNSGNPRLYETIFDVDETRLLQSIVIVDNAVPSDPDVPQHNIIMAVSGDTVPEPATLVLLVAGMGAVFAVRRRK
ncbi:MAG TPA: PEP-CTERM sorting domain-containing protein [Phycisphaerae bacterium]|nr:PEP-CTERM sorting domain-containing protein [Phycisphaerae bacterium]HPS52094.1 PEP-CTERM sorting domain-containing protein [Phycisphaerae bacterium]